MTFDTCHMTPSTLGAALAHAAAAAAAALLVAPALAVAAGHALLAPAPGPVLLPGLGLVADDHLRVDDDLVPLGQAGEHLDHLVVEHAELDLLLDRPGGGEHEHLPLRPPLGPADHRLQRHGQHGL